MNLAMASSGAALARMNPYTEWLCEGTGHAARQCMAGREGGGERVPQRLVGALEQQGVTDTAIARHPRLDNVLSVNAVGRGEDAERVVVALLVRARLEIMPKARITEEKRLHHMSLGVPMFSFRRAFAPIEGSRQ